MLAAAYIDLTSNKHSNVAASNFSFNPTTRSTLLEIRVEIPKLQPLIALFELQKSRLAFLTPAIAAARAVGPDHPVTGYYQR